MPFSREAIEQLAQLARLDVENTRDNGSIQDDLNRIVAMVDQISAANTETVEPIAQPSDASQRLRADIITETDEREDLLALAPETEAGLFLVPTVIE